MKRIFFLMTLLVVSLTIQAQKQKKPNINKAEILRVKGELAEAKEIIDLAIDYEKTKDNGKTWYYRALIYATIDTTSNPEIAGLSDDALTISVESFAKATELGDPQKAFFTTGPLGIVTQDQQYEEYYSYYFNRAVQAFGDNEYQTAVDEFYNASMIKPEDSDSYKNAAYAAHNGELWDTAISAYRRAIDQGSKSKDLFTNLVNIYVTAKEDKEAALAVSKEGRKIYPSDSELARNEINLLIQLDKVEEAKDNLLLEIESDPENTNLLFTLAAMYEELEDEEQALKSYETAIKVDPNHYESNFNRGVILLNRANEVFKEYTNLGISKADMAKAKELEPKIETGYSEAMPQWEKLWEIKPDDRQIGETLVYIYRRVEKYDEAEAVQTDVDKLPAAE